MNDNTQYLKGRIAGLEQICDALYKVLCRDLPATSDDIELRLRVSRIMAELINDTKRNTTFASSPFGQGACDALADFADKLTN